MTEIDYVKIFKALSDEMRLKILQEIAKHEEICVCKLMEQFAIAQSKLSYHLKLLLEANLIKLTYSPCLKAGDSWIQTILAY